MSSIISASARRFRPAVIVAAIALAAGALAGCASDDSGSEETPVLPPVIKTVNELQGATVEVPIDTVLVVNTESLATDSYTATIDDPAIVEFVQGTTGGSAETYPGFTPLEEGETTVTLTNENGGIEPLEFTIVVTAASNGTGN